MFMKYNESESASVVISARVKLGLLDPQNPDFEIWVKQEIPDFDRRHVVCDITVVDPWNDATFLPLFASYHAWSHWCYSFFFWEKCKQEMAGFCYINSDFLNVLAVFPV